MKTTSDNLKTEDNLKIRDNFKNEDNLKNEEDLKNEGELKSEDDLKNKDDLINTSIVALGASAPHHNAALTSSFKMAKGSQNGQQGLKRHLTRGYWEQHRHSCLAKRKFKVQTFFGSNKILLQKTLIEK